MINANQTPPNLDGPTSIPVQAVDADQLPREKGLTYEEVSSIIGALYLDSHHQMKVNEEQFSAVVDEYEKRLMQMQAQIQVAREELERSRQEVSALRRELEKRDGRQHDTGTGSSPSDNGNDSVPGN